MSLPKLGSAVSFILGVALLTMGTVVADDEQTRRAGRVDKRVIERDRSEGLEDAITRGRTVEPTEIRPTLGRSARSATQESRPRVLVRDLRDRGSRERELWWYSAGAPGTRYYSPYVYRYGCDPYPAWRRLADAYRAYHYVHRKERERRFNRKDMAEREQRLLDRHEQALAAGLQRLKAGEPARAIVALTLAAKLNQGDPACRVHLAQARLAQGHYLEAGLALRRALQLQPKLVYVDLHLRSYYEAEDALDQYTDALDEWSRKNNARPEVHFLLGFLEFQRGDFVAAHAAFRRVADALPDDDLTRDYLEITKPAGTE